MINNVTAYIKFIHKPEFYFMMQVQDLDDLFMTIISHPEFKESDNYCRKNLDNKEQIHPRLWVFEVFAIDLSPDIAINSRRSAYFVDKIINEKITQKIKNENSFWISDIISYWPLEFFGKNS